MGLLNILASAAAIFQTTADLPSKPRFGSCLAESQLSFQSGTVTQLQKVRSIVIGMNFDNTGLQINDGIVEFTVNLNGIPYTHSQSICSLDKTLCPLAPGLRVFHTEPIDLTDIHGRLKIKIHVKHQNGGDLMCVFGDMMVEDGHVIGGNFIGGSNGAEHVEQVEN
ncbi:MAG: hypothetical protein EBT86_03940 [Actinobacteria bacterium]|nr:hypothetical protein [Actinomycetota bacterium]